MRALFITLALSLFSIIGYAQQDAYGVYGGFTTPFQGVDNASFSIGLSNFESINPHFVLAQHIFMSGDEDFRNVNLGPFVAGGRFFFHPSNQGLSFDGDFGFDVKYSDYDLSGLFGFGFYKLISESFAFDVGVQYVSKQNQKPFGMFRLGFFSVKND